MDTELSKLLEENSFIEVQEWLMNLDRKVTDEDFDGSSEARKDHKLNLGEAAMIFVKTYAGYSDFMRSLKSQILRKDSLSVKQCRASLNVMKSDLDAGRMAIAIKTGRAPAVPLVKPEANNTEAPEGTVPVLAVQEKSLLDISGLPDGRYAIPAPHRNPSYIFLKVTTLKRPTRRDRRYRYGKYRVGNEMMPAGTIEIREWSQDAKRLCGQAKPGEGYQGEYIDELAQLLVMPEVYALMFAAYIGACSICGKTLTDDNSRELKIGPECYKTWGMDYWKKYVRPKEFTIGGVTFQEGDTQLKRPA